LKNERKVARRTAAKPLKPASPLRKTLLRGEAPLRIESQIKMEIDGAVALVVHHC
jgi:hypothetical protein